MPPRPSRDSAARPKTCQWIEGGVRPGVRPVFCAQSVLPGCSYCPEHQRRAYARPADPALAHIGRLKVPS